MCELGKFLGGEAGLAIELVRDVSWANLRDRLAVGVLDAAHMLAPAAIASTLGLGHLLVPMAAPIMLNLSMKYVIKITLLCDDLQGADYRDMVKIVESIRIKSK